MKTTKTQIQNIQKDERRAAIFHQILAWSIVFLLAGGMALVIKLFFRDHITSI